MSIVIPNKLIIGDVDKDGDILVEVGCWSGFAEIYLTQNEIKIVIEHLEKQLIQP